nr:PREDICTED: uncharacterized protein LOC105663923 [Megachile rotundata]
MNGNYKWCMFFLTVIGLWPYSNKKFRLLQNGIISLITWASVIFQFIALFSLEGSLFRLLRIIAFISGAITALTKYHITWYMIDDVKVFLDRIRREWETNNDDTLRIMQIHAIRGKRLVISFAVGAESLMIMITSHIAGLFEVASLFFEKAVLADSSVSYLPRNCRNNESINYIIRGTTIHRMALQFVRDLNNHCNISYGPTIIFGVIALSSHSFCLSQTIFRAADSEETILSVCLINSTLGYMFWMNFAAGNMISMAESIPLTT